MSYIWCTFSFHNVFYKEKDLPIPHTLLVTQNKANSNTSIRPYECKAETNAHCRGNELSPQKLTTDFLKCVRQHTEIVLKDKVSPVALESTPIEYVVSIYNPSYFRNELTIDRSLCLPFGRMERKRKQDYVLKKLGWEPGLHFTSSQSLRQQRCMVSTFLHLWSSFIPLSASQPVPKEFHDGQILIIIPSIALKIL